MNEIKDARLALGWSQQKMSDELEIPKRTIQDWETVKRTPPVYVEKLERIIDNKNLFSGLLCDFAIEIFFSKYEKVLLDSDYYETQDKELKNTYGLYSHELWDRGFISDDINSKITEKWKKYCPNNYVPRKQRLFAAIIMSNNQIVKNIEIYINNLKEEKDLDHVQGLLDTQRSELNQHQ